MENQLFTDMWNIHEKASEVAKRIAKAEAEARTSERIAAMKHVGR
jgi:hypothetical protein